MTRDELLELLRGWAPIETPTGRTHCSECGDIIHDHDCRLAKAIAWLEDEGNKEFLDDRSNGSESKGVWWGWVLR